MTEKLLPYDRSIVGQETGWNCGPAATQVVLQSRGIFVAESELARQIGTHTGGTDFVGLIERVLDQRVPDARFTSVYLEQDPATPAQVEALWSHIVESIDAGWGVVMNWVAPPSNKPRGVKGSMSPRYSGGTTFHYVACMGYDDTPGARAVWIADSGFQPQGYWISFDQCATLIPPKGYAYADAGVAAPPTQTDAVAVLSRAMGASLSMDRYAALAPAVNDALTQCATTTVQRIAMWCAQIGHESGGLRWMEEIADGSAYEGRSDLGNNQPGDGRRFKGHGPIQITGRSNHTRVSEWAHSKGLVPSPTFFVDHPEQLGSDRYGFVGVVWYWTVARPQINSMSDSGDLEGVTQAINGGLNGLDDRRARYNRCLAMGQELLKLTEATGELSMADAHSLTQQFAGLNPDGTPLHGPDGADYRRVDWLNDYDGPETPEVAGPHTTRSTFDEVTLLSKLFGRVYTNKHGQKLNAFDLLVGAYQAAGEPRVAKGPIED